MNIIKDQNHPKYKSANLTIKNIYLEEGIKGFYRGTKSALMTIPFFHSLYFPIYEFSKDFYSSKIYGNSKKFNALIYTLSSATSAIICDIITNPMWIVRVRHQTEYIHSGKNNKESFNIIKEIYKLYKNVNKIFFI